MKKYPTAGYAVHLTLPYTVQYLQHTVDINTWIRPSIRFCAQQKIEEPQDIFVCRHTIFYYYIKLNVITIEVQNCFKQFYTMNF